MVYPKGDVTNSTWPKTARSIDIMEEVYINVWNKLGLIEEGYRVIDLKGKKLTCREMLCFNLFENYWRRGLFTWEKTISWLNDDLPVKLQKKQDEYLNLATSGKPLQPIRYYQPNIPVVNSLPIRALVIWYGVSKISKSQIKWIFEKIVLLKEIDVN